MEGDLGLGKAIASVPFWDAHEGPRAPVTQAGGQLPGRLPEPYEAAV